MYELLYVDQLRNMLHKFATYIVNQFGVGRVATAGTRWILYQASSHLVEMAQCRQRLSEIHMRCKVGTRQHDFLNAHTHVHTITALNYKLMHSHLYVAVHSLVYIAVHFPNDLLLIRIQHTQGFSLQQTRNLDLPAVLLRLDAGHTRTI